VNSKPCLFFVAKLIQIMSYSTKILLFSFAFIFISFNYESKAQSLTDGIYMPRKSICAGLVYTNDAFSKYWEGKRNRTNENIGTVTTQSLGLMANYGLSNRLNLVAMLPYIKTNASAGTLAGLQGVQDLTLALKYKLISKRVLKGDASLQLIGGGSMPTTDYVADFLPLSIGMHCNTAFGRVLLHYLTDNHFSFAAYSTYQSRGNVQLDRNSYYTTQQIESTEASVPDIFNFGARIGYYRYRWQAELLLDRTQCVDGTDIRRQDMPFLSNKMETTKVGVTASYRIKAIKDLQLVGTAFQTVAGRNAGQSFFYSLGLMKAFGAYK
jgi:hypothetical protein